MAYSTKKKEPAYIAITFIKISKFSLERRYSLFYNRYSSGKIYFMFILCLRVLLSECRNFSYGDKKWGGSKKKYVEKSTRIDYIFYRNWCPFSPLHMKNVLNITCSWFLFCLVHRFLIAWAWSVFSKIRKSWMWRFNIWRCST